MKQRFAVLFVLALLSVGYAQQKAPVSKISGTFSSVSTAVPITIDNQYGTQTATFEESYTGSPATVSIVIKGCMSGGTCDVLETNTSTASSNRAPTISKVYDYFTVTPTLTGGTSPTIVVHWTLGAASSKAGSGSGSGATTCSGLSDAAPSCSVDATLVANVVGAAPLTSPALTGTPTAPTPTGTDNSTKLATTAYVKGQGYATTASLATVATSGLASDLTGTLAAGRFPSFTAHSLLFGNGSAGSPSLLTSPVTNGNCFVSFNVVSSAAVDPACALSGILVNAQSGNYSLAFSDRGSYILYSGGTTATLTLCQITGTCAGNFPFVVQNLNSGNLTVTANAADKIDNGSTGGSITLLPNQIAFVYQDSSSAPGNWKTAKFNNSSAAGGSGNVSNNTTNTFTSAGTLDLSAALATAGIRLPNAAGAAPTVAGNIAFDTTTNSLKCGDGTNTRSCVEHPLIAGVAASTCAASATCFGPVIGSSTVQTTENLRQENMPFTGIVRDLCVRTLSGQPATGSLTIILHDSTANADVSGLSVVIAASSAAGIFCDTTNTSAIVANHDYAWKFTEGVTNASATMTSVSAVYRY